MRNPKRNILIVLAMIYLAQIAYFYPQLPEKVASHFNHLGEADGWMSKTEYTIFQIVLLGFILALTSLIPVLFKKMPDSMINIPHKSYWLAPERREESILKLAVVTDSLRIALLLFFLGINYCAFQANVTGGNLSNGTWAILGVFLIYTIYWTVGLRKTFKV